MIVSNAWGGMPRDQATGADRPNGGPLPYLKQEMTL